jgi:hypothetical protein
MRLGREKQNMNTLNEPKQEFSKRKKVNCQQCARFSSCSSAKYRKNTHNTICWIYEPLKGKFIENGLEEEEPQHWETWEGIIYIYKTKYGNNQRQIIVPYNIVHHLGLHHKQKIQVAIKTIEEGGLRKP